MGKDILEQIKEAKTSNSLLKFGYVISDDKHDFRILFNESQILNYQINYEGSNYFFIKENNYFFIKSEKNYALIELIDHPEKLKTAREFTNPDFHRNFRHASGLIIYVFGEKEVLKNFLLSIRNTIEKEIAQKNIEFDINKIEKYTKKKFVSRFFYYSYTPELETIIDYDKLLKLKEAKENVYFDDDAGKKLPIIDLLKYVGAENVKIEKKWNGTNYITTARVQNFKIFKDIEITFSKNINILLGNNGLGKTSLLQAITFGLLQNQNNDCPDDLQDFINFNSEKSDITINWGENERRKIYVFEEGNPVDDEIFALPQHLLLSYGVNINTNKELDHTKIVNELIEGESELYFTKSIFEDNYKNLYDPLIILKYLDDKMDTSAGTQEIREINLLLKETLNEYLALVDKKEQIQITFEEKDNRYYLTDLYQNKLEFQHLSEGYKDHILLITDIIIRILASREKLLEKEKHIIINNELFRKINAVILIDEFDRHLHPTWQRKLLSKFKEDFPNIQFILTTHNPFSVQSGVGANCIQLIVENGLIVPKNTIIQSKNILSIIREYFTKDFFDDKAQDLLRQFSNYFDKINEGEIELVYSKEFKETVKQIFDKGEEFQATIVGQILQLNAALKKLNLKEFEL